MAAEEGDPLLKPFAVALRRARLREDSHNAETIYFPASYERDLYVTLAESASKSIDCLKICSSESIPIAPYESTVWRDLATMGITARIIYLVSHVGLLKSALRDRIRLDKESGIEVRIIAAHELPESIASLQLGDYHIVDSRLASYRNISTDLSQGETGLWTISTAEENVDKIHTIFSQIWGVAADPDTFQPGLDLEEPLVQSAPILAQVAPVLCRGDHIDSEGCDWYHGSWQFLRLMDLVSTPAWHHSFYQRALSAEISKGARNILITGTADYSVFAYVMEALGDRPDATVTVVDLCHTPLFACQWYAKQLGFSHLNLMSDDIFSFFAETRDSFDLVVTDAFLTRFFKDNSRAVLRGWHGILTDRGCVVTTVRVHSEAESGQTAQEAIAGFRSRAQNRWHRWAPFIDIPAVEIADRAELYARRMVSRPIGPPAQIMSMLSERFDLTSHDLASVPGELYPTKYIRVVLTKRV